MQTSVIMPAMQTIALESFGLETITIQDNHFVNTIGQPFDTATYSRFKYGDARAASLYGKRVAKCLEHRFHQGGLPLDEAMVMTASAYKQLPTAAESVVSAARMSLLGKGYSPLRGRIHRANLTTGDYALMSAEERALVMQQNGIFFDESLFNGRHVVVVDDIKITGAHEQSIVKLFENRDILSLTHLYVVRMDPEVGALNPAIESELNQAWVNGLERLGELINLNPLRYSFNARTTKMVLGAKEHELKGFLSQLRNWHIRQLYAGAIGDGYNVMEPYVAGFWCLHHEASERGIIALNDG